MHPGMARVIPVPESRLRIEREPDGLHVALARQRPWWRYLMPAWILLILVLGGAGMLSDGTQQDGAGVAFFVVWFGVLLAALAAALWTLLAREELVLDDEALTRAVGLGPITRRRSYLRSHIEDLRVSTTSFSLFDPRAGLRMWGLGGGGAIAFDYGDRTIHVGDVEEAQAKRVVAALSEAGLPRPGA
jgi:hypothetical protein